MKIRYKSNMKHWMIFLQVVSHLYMTDAVVYTALFSLFLLFSTFPLIGLSSKRRHTRAPGQQGLTFLLQSELHIYCNYHVIPFLRRLFASGQNLFIWLAVLMTFRQIRYIVQNLDPAIHPLTYESVGQSICPALSFFTVLFFFSDPEEIYDRWSSFRNQNWLLTSEQASTHPPSPSLSLPLSHDHSPPRLYLIHSLFPIHLDARGTRAKDSRTS